MKIWVLFGVDDLHDQPPHNLIAWQAEKPTLELLFRWLHVEAGRDSDETIVAAVKIWAGESQDIRSTRYRLREISDGEVDSRETE